MGFIRHHLGPLALLLSTPVLVMYFVYDLLRGPFSPSVVDFFRPTAPAAAFVAGFVVFQVILLLALPGRAVAGPVGPSGFAPTYRGNGLLAFVLTMLVFVGVPYWTNIFSPAIYFRMFGPLCTILNGSALLLSCLLYWKGLRWPSSKDSGGTGRRIFDFYYGTEAYPSIGGIALKQLVNCRIGMMLWALFAVSCWFRQFDFYDRTKVAHSISVSVGLEVVYIAKFFFWEASYFSVRASIPPR